MFKAFLNPNPIAKSDSARQTQSRENSDRPGRGEKEQIYQQDNGRNRMETEIYHRY